MIRKVDSMVTGFNHIGICVHSIDKTFAWMKNTMGAELISKTAYPDRNQVSAIVVLPDGLSKFELMEPIGNEGTVASFLSKKGEGIHHVSLKINDLEETCTCFMDSGNQIIGKTNGLAFIHPKTSGGVLYELSDGTFGKSSPDSN